jgi:hypothetical protein
MIYYQDTDSLHIANNGLSKLFKLYKAKYGRELDGDNMGQFNSDFELSFTTVSGEVKKNIDCHDVQSILFIGLGKKCYIDALRGSYYGITGELKFKYGFHMRMKGVSRSCLPYTANEKFEGDIIKLYESLYSGNSVKFDMLQGGLKCSMVRFKNMTIGNKTSFIRELKF